jgi:hypothetical protein
VFHLRTTMHHQKNHPTIIYMSVHRLYLHVFYIEHFYLIKLVFHLPTIRGQSLLYVLSVQSHLFGKTSDCNSDTLTLPRCMILSGSVILIRRQSLAHLRLSSIFSITSIF